MTYEQIEKAKNKSLSSNKIVVSKEKLKKTIALTFISGAISTMLLGTAIITSVNNYREYAEETELIEDNIDYIRDLVSRNTYRINGTDFFAYNETAIAEELLENPSELDTNIYALYNRIGYNGKNKIDEMNKIMDIMNKINHNENIQTYSSFYEYADSKQLLDENGKIKLKEFRKFAADSAKANDIFNISSYKGVK